MRVLIFSLLTFCVSLSHAESKNNNWYGFGWQNKVNDSWSLEGSMNFRFEMADYHFYETILPRIGIFYHSSEAHTYGLELDQRYASVSGGHHFGQDQRVRLQHLYSYQFLGSDKLRSLLESTKGADSPHLAVRLRERARFPIYKGESYALEFSYEIFMNLTSGDSEPVSFVDEQRFRFTNTFNVAKNWELDLEYMPALITDYKDHFIQQTFIVGLTYVSE